MVRFSLLLAALGLSGFSALAAPNVVASPDSIGVEYRNNKMLIRHRVAAGETLYGLARRYRVPVEQIVEANAGLKGALTTGQVVLVPRPRVVLPAAPAAPHATAAPAAPAGAARTYPAGARGRRTHKVQPGQTLFGIARLYSTTPQEIARLNNFPSTYNVRVGETLVVAGSAPAARRETPVPAAAPAPREEPREVAAAPAPRATPAAPAPAAPAPAPTTAPAAPARDKDSTAAAATEKEEDRAPTRASEIVRRVSESGLATSIPNSTTDKYLALHKTAAVGTIMQVRNIMNGQSVYVRVIGPLPDTGENANILVRLSPRAVQRLATPDARFRVETSYVP